MVALTSAPLLNFAVILLAIVDLPTLGRPRTAIVYPWADQEARKASIISRRGATSTALMMEGGCQPRFDLA